MKKFIHSKAGFTLIEVLISMFILGVIGVILADLLAQSFKNNVDIQLTSKLKQNGQTALNIIDQTIRTSDSIICVGNYPSSTANKTIIIRKNDLSTRFIMVLPSGGQNGYIIQDAPLISDPSDPSITAPFCNPASLPGAGSVPLTNKDLQTGVSLISGDFIRYGNDAVSISFRLGPAVQSGVTASLGSSFADFQTTIQLR